ncbi:TraR/DksA C4-type zinc finger protein [Peribacillus kribbensis]|uniref:TraR/DksA C4-type zinc finger protein n=1 Tax=Peribacillus kribbensis TaxID=356658 RepID=UPI0004067C35|nr:TraR/DksA C4-type zinc finger protein [Peribacillus kribbensis]
MLDEKQMESLKEQLLSMKEDLETQVNMQDPSDDSITDSVGEISSLDNHPGDLGTELFEKEKDIALEDHNSNELQKVKDALQAMEDGNYGKCLACGREIPYERLEALPSALYCIDHASEQNISNYRPVEEDVLEPSHRDSFQRLRDNHIINDEIDSFEDVARYGTSETPSDYYEKFKDYNSMDKEKDDTEGFPEEYENFAGNDIDESNVRSIPSKENSKFERELDEEGLDSNIGDIPYHLRDSYLEESGKSSKDKSNK